MRLLKENIALLFCQKLQENNFKRCSGNHARGYTYVSTPLFAIQIRVQDVPYCTNIRLM